MAKKAAKRSTSSSKAVKFSGKKYKAPQKSSGKSTPKKKASRTTKKRISYKDEYVKLLQRTNKTLTKEVRAIKKAIEQPGAIPQPQSSSFEAFPKEPSPIHYTPPQPVSIEAQILATLQDLELQVRSRDMAFEDLMSGSAKLGGLDG
jgi:hypothetical protein